MFKYSASVSFDKDTETYEISYKDFKNVYAVAYSEDDIELQAMDGLLAGIAEHIDCRIPIPEPSTHESGEIIIVLPILTCLKITLHNAMIQTGTRKIDLARKLNQKGPQVDRLLDITHASKVETLEQALFLLGYEVFVSVKKSKK